MTGVCRSCVMAAPVYARPATGQLLRHIPPRIRWTARPDGDEGNRRGLPAAGGVFLRRKPIVTPRVAARRDDDVIRRPGDGAAGGRAVAADERPMAAAPTVTRARGGSEVHRVCAALLREAGPMPIVCASSEKARSACRGCRDSGRWPRRRSTARQVAPEAPAPSNREDRSPPRRGCVCRPRPASRRAASPNTTGT